MVKNPPASAGDVRDRGLIPGLGRSPGGGHGTPLWYSGESHGQRGLVGYSPEVAKSWTRLKQQRVGMLAPKRVPANNKCLLNIWENEWKPPFYTSKLQSNVLALGATAPSPISSCSV